MFRFSFDSPGPVVRESQYYCHLCSGVVQTYTENDERYCVTCKETYVEELESPEIPEELAQNAEAPGNNQSNPNPNPFDLSGFINQMRERAGARNADNNGGGANPFNFIQQMMNSMNQAAENGGNVNFQQFNLNGTNLFNGPTSMEELLNRIFEEHADQGPPPADKEAVNNLPRRFVKEGDDALEVECSVCKDSYNIDEEVIELPCKHLFHPDCILPWLEMRNTCPTCRFELPKAKEEKKEEPKEDERRPSPAQSNDSGVHHETDHLYL